jgi:hypothetical protein
MSIASTVAALERANGACNAAQAAATPIAKRGMFAMVERRHRYGSLLCGAYAGYVGYTPCLVSSVDRAGIVKEVRLVGQTWPLKRRDWDQIMSTVPAGSLTRKAWCANSSTRTAARASSAIPASRSPRRPPTGYRAGCPPTACKPLLRLCRS